MAAWVESYEVTATRWAVNCDCPTPIGKAECQTEREAVQMLEHHERQTEHQEWEADQ